VESEAQGIKDHLRLLLARTKKMQASQKSAESWLKYIPPQQVIDDATSKIEGWPEYANRVILMTPQDKLLNFELVWRDPQPIWTSKSGRIVQIGDAAHTFLPSSGNGANQAMEDAISLAKCLQIAGNDNIGEATKVHNKLR
jgi:2-polyprenyl-6-methoxyphenol hydroxylase-like FAD-dependent oxidoreductase